MRRTFKHADDTEERVIIQYVFVHAVVVEHDYHSVSFPTTRRGVYGRTYCLHTGTQGVQALDPLQVLRLHEQVDKRLDVVLCEAVRSVAWRSKWHGHSPLAE